MIALCRNDQLLWWLTPFKPDKGGIKTSEYYYILWPVIKIIGTSNLHINSSVWNKTSIPIALKYWPTASGCSTVSFNWLSQFFSTLNNWKQVNIIWQVQYNVDIAGSTISRSLHWYGLRIFTWNFSFKWWVSFFIIKEWMVTQDTFYNSTWFCTGTELKHRSCWSDVLGLHVIVNISQLYPLGWFTFFTENNLKEEEWRNCQWVNSDL